MKTDFIFIRGGMAGSIAEARLCFFMTWGGLRRWQAGQNSRSLEASFSQTL
jgi:hypothetical protein